MSDTDERPPERSGGKTRRRILGTIGAGGLATAAAVFGRSAPAFAGNYGCCNLAFTPGSSRYIGWSSCTSYRLCPNCLGKYIWYCSKSPSMDCGCCELYSGNYNWQYSGATCYYA